MKNDPKGLSKILNGKLIIPLEGSCMYITADEDDAKEFICIPWRPKDTRTHRLMAKWRAANHRGYSAVHLFAPDENDELKLTKCISIKNNGAFIKENFTWVGNEVSGCWAYYPKKPCI